MPSPGPDLDRVIARIRQWQKLTEQLPPAVEAQSALAEDAANSPVYDVGHAAWAGFAQAVDHLHAVQALITEAKMLHTYAPFSLIRGAMDNAALAVWLLAPESPDERLTRRLHLAYEDMRQSHDAYSLLGPSAPASRRPIEVRKQEVIDLAKSLRLDAGAVGGRWTGYEKIVRQLAAVEPGHPRVGEQRASSGHRQRDEVRHRDHRQAARTPPRPGRSAPPREAELLPRQPRCPSRHEQQGGGRNVACHVRPWVAR